MNRTTIRRIVWVLILICAVSALPLSADAQTPVIIVLDPGHGGSDVGSVVTYSGVDHYEADLVWKIANHCKEYLETYYTDVTVYLTRTEDESPSLQERVAYAVSANADFLLSIHLNIYNEGTARGATALVPAGTYNPGQAEISQTVADILLGKLEALGLKNRGLYTNTLKATYYPNGKGVDSYYLLRHAVTSNLPCIIMEECFLDDANDYLNVLATEEKLRTLAAANAQALAEYFDLPANPNAPVPEPVEEPAPEPEIEGTTPSPEPVEEQETGSGLGAVLKVVGIVALGWLAVKCWQFQQFRKREEAKRRARAQAARRRKACQVNPDGTYARPQRKMKHSEYDRPQPRPRRDPGSSRRSADHYNHMQ